tara:strand:+ start:5033 stop:5743 length:711 start_codon:yes stop_codon:yes gene_type:complete
VIKPEKSNKSSKKIQVRSMFNSIAHRYDFINGIMTFNMDKYWRREVCKIVLENNPDTIIDIATGTGDIAFDLIQKNNCIIGIDNAKQMLEIANQKKTSGNISFQLEDAENMSFKNNSFNAATVSFGVRNFEDLFKGLTEIKRILTPGGKLVILETAVPSFFILRFGYFLYTKMIIPLIGKIIAQNKNAYKYLSNSAEHFPHGEEFKLILERIGFKDIGIKYLSLGIVNIYYASKPK